MTNTHSPIFDPVIEKNIKTRAKYLSKIFPSLQEDDLVQEGYLTILEILHNKKNKDVLSLLKSINNKFSKISRDEAYRTKTNVSLGDLDVVDDYTDKKEDIEIGYKVRELLKEGVPIEDALDETGVSEEVKKKLKKHNWQFIKRSKKWQKFMNAE